MVYLFLADGFEELEAVAVIDILRRAEIDVKTVGVNGETAVSARGVEIRADLDIAYLPYTVPELLILPGGLGGVENLGRDMTVRDMLRDAFAKNIPVAAICAAPMLLAELGLLKDRKVTCYPAPAIADKVKAGGGRVSKKLIQRDGNLITGAGPGAAMPFALAIVCAMKGKKQAQKIAKDMLISAEKSDSALGDVFAEILGGVFDMVT